MNKIRTLTLAGLLGLIGFAGGHVNEAAAQAAVDYRPGADRAIIAIQPGDQGSERGIIAIKPGEDRGLIGLNQPTDQKGGFVREAYGDALGRKAGGDNGGANALIGLLHPTDLMPTDQVRTGRGDGFVQGVYGDLLNRNAGGGSTGELVPAVIPNDGDAVGPKAGGLGSLMGVGSTNNLFLNSHGGDQGNGLLLPAIRKADGSVKLGDAKGSDVTHGAGGGTGMPTDQKSLTGVKVDGAIGVDAGANTWAGKGSQVSSYQTGGYQAGGSGAGNPGANKSFSWGLAAKK